MENIEIKPIEKIITKVIKKVTVRVVELKLFTSVSISVYMYGDNKEFIERHLLVMDGDDYKNWNNDDEYLINYVFTKLNLERLPKPIVVEPETIVEPQTIVEPETVVEPESVA